MFRNTWALVAIALLAAPAILVAETFTDDFEGGTNAGGWYYNHGETIETTGGNPDGWLHNSYIDNFAVIFKSAWYTPNFTGDYRAMNVDSFSFDGRLDLENIPMYMSILLRDTNGTPTDFDDDDYAYTWNGLIPQTPGVWEHYDFPIPSSLTDPVPTGWSGGWSGDIESFRPGVDWNDVVTSVDRVEIWFWHPAYFGIFRIWDAGIDNVTISRTGAVSVESTTWSQIKGLYR